MNGCDKYIRFDWAAKKILRDKANFSILEGLITVLLNDDTKIIEILESESNQSDPDDKFNRVDIKAKNSKGEIILVEIQQTREVYYLERILYGVANAITEHIHKGDKYDQVKKVYSISILYFDLGKGEDYIYRGQTVFHGLTKHDTLQITEREKDGLNMKAPEDVFPEYYLIRVKSFDKIAENHLEEWIKYLKDGDIDESTTAPGLREAKRKLEYLSMTEKERKAYDRHIDNIMIQNDMFDTAAKEGLAQGVAIGRAEGRAEGLAEGREEGLAEGREEGEKAGVIKTAISLKALGVPTATISQATGLTAEDIDNL
ncbi:MAG: Rpn family recombination-promoting nuclease/putative transposase [Bacteroidales bacterium]|nr:Rpn family recombination-promoting nuclease/putative transposase [Bacteroidales bacterium]